MGWRWGLIVVFLVLAFMAPGPLGVGGFVSIASADDDDDGGGGGGGGRGGTGGGWSGGGDSGAAATRLRSRQFTWPFARPRAKAQRRVARRAERRQRPRPARVAAASVPVAARPAAAREYIAWWPGGATAPIALPEGYALIDRDRVGSLRGDLWRIRAPAGRGDQRARAELQAALPAAEISRNESYRLNYRVSGVRARGKPDGFVPGPPLACARGARLALIDTGVDPLHPALANQPIGVMAVRAVDRVASSTAHGTAVASALVARADAGVPALAAGAGLIAIDAFHKDARGRDVTDAFDFARALDRVAGLDIALLNLSVAGPDHPMVARVIAHLVANGILVVAAAGNDGPRAPPAYPAAYPGVIGVTAVDPDGAPWRGAARGSHIDVAATGVRIALAGPNDAVATFTGTSFAAPIISAVLAGEIGRPGLGPLTTADAATARLAVLARDLGPAGRDDRFGHGWVEPARGCGG